MHHWGTHWSLKMLPRPACHLLPILVLLSAGCSDNATPDAVGLLEWDRVELVAEASEPITGILVREGERVAAGDLILRQDSRRLQAQLDEAAAARAQSAARLAELRRGARVEHLDEARARLQGAESEVETLRHELKRQQSMADKKLASPEAADLARMKLDQAIAGRDMARAQLNELLAGVTVEELQQAEAALAQADARVRVLQVSLDRLDVRAPRAGLLDTLPFEVGEQPPVGAVIAVLLDGAAPYARVYLPEPLHARVAVNTRVRVFVDGIDQPFTGHVRMLSRDAVFTPFYTLTERDRARLSYLAEVQLEGEAAAGLPAGAPLRVEIAGAGDGAP